MEIFSVLIFIIGFCFTEQQQQKSCVEFKQHLNNINKTLEASEKNVKESIRTLNDKVQDQKVYCEQANINTIYRLQSMMLQQKSMIDSIVDETAVLEDSLKTQNKTFVLKFQNLKQNAKHLKDNFKEYNTSFVKFAAKTDLKLAKVHEELVSLRNEYNRSQQRNEENFLALKIHQNKTDKVTGDNIHALTQNQTRLEIILQEQKQQIRELAEQIADQNTVLADGNTTIWQFVKPLSTNQDAMKGQINQQNTQIQTKIQSLETSLNNEKTQITNSINRFQTTLNSLHTKVTQGPKYCGCTWTGYVNWYDREAQYAVSNGQVLAGISSVHHNHYEDRRFRFYVCNFC